MRVKTEWPIVISHKYADELMTTFVFHRSLTNIIEWYSVEVQFLAKAPFRSTFVRLSHKNIRSDRRTPITRMSDTAARKLLNEKFPTRVENEIVGDTKVCPLLEDLVSLDHANRDVLLINDINRHFFSDLGHDRSFACSHNS